MVWRNLAGIVALVALLAAAMSAAGAATGTGSGVFRAELSGFQEVPAVSTMGRGSFWADVDANGDGAIRDPHIHYELTYTGLEAPAQAAHIHFAQRDVNGGVVAFLCGGGGKPDCAGGMSGRVRGVLTAADVIGPEGQGIAPGEFSELVRAMNAGVTYVNVHTPKFPAGEIRGQIYER